MQADALSSSVGLVLSWPSTCMYVIAFLAGLLGNGGYMCWVDITAGSGQTALEFQCGLLKVAGVQLGA